MEFEVKSEVYNLDGSTQLEFISRKTVVVIDKDRFSVCKQLLLENALDHEFASFLNIPEDKVGVFKYKMQLFEESIRARRRTAKLAKNIKAASRPTQKREISSEERFRRARELISKGLSTNQISKVLKVSERSVTRFKRRMREEKKRLKAEGKIAIDPNDPDDDNNFKHLPTEQKLQVAKEMFRKRLKIQEISEILKISERSVRRWKDRLASEAKIEMKAELDMEEMETDSSPKKLSKRMTKLKAEPGFQHEDEDIYYEEAATEQTSLPKKRKLFVDREKVEYARELIENKMSNKDMSRLLELTIACVRKLKLKILNGTVDELIDDSEEHYTKVGKGDTDADPLNVAESYYVPIPSTSYHERKPKVVLSDREMYIARLLRENGIRTMDIAKLMQISERSVTRLLARSKELETLEFEDDVVTEVNRMLTNKDQLLDSDVIFKELDKVLSKSSADESKKKLGLSLIKMKVKSKDIAKMLDCSEKTVQRWKSKTNHSEVDETLEETAENSADAMDSYDDLVEHDVEPDEDDFLVDDVVYEEFEVE